MPRLLLGVLLLAAVSVAPLAGEPELVCEFPAPAATSCGMTLVGATRVSPTAGLGQVAVHGELAAVVQRDDGAVALVDVSDPAGPELLGRYDGGWGHAALDHPLDGDVVFSHDGRYLFYARQTREFSQEGLHVLDVSEPADPRRVDFAPAGGMIRVAYHSAGDAEHLVTLDAVTGMTVYRFVRTPLGGSLVPVHVDTLPALKVGGPASAGVFVDPADPMLGVPLLYVTTGRTGLQVYDFSAPAHPRLLGSWTAEGLADLVVHVTDTARTVYAATEYWFAANRLPRVVELDATDLSDIGERARFNPADALFPGGATWRVQGLHLHGDLLYVAHSHAGVAVVDTCCEPGELRAATGELGERSAGSPFAMSPYAMDVTVSGDVVFVTDGSTGTLSTFRLQR